MPARHTYHLPVAEVLLPASPLALNLMCLLPSNGAALTTGIRRRCPLAWFVRHHSTTTVVIRVLVVLLFLLPVDGVATLLEVVCAFVLGCLARDVVESIHRRGPAFTWVLLIIAPAWLF
ncbi:hypothetical protein QBC35DRAFT_500460 [Podospora australis]|uniref:Uncharacterized protein n=1 Tax=Podospora australis TaxID=1536484 RepID=A0AAN6WRE3_9PEZI|nr:hypothetical protein QBC35DRAFT_500460 [Podospora australis]